jgi:hypothetical protein
MARASGPRAVFGPRGNRALLAVCGVLVLAVAVLAGVLIGGSGGDADAQATPAVTPSPGATSSPTVAEIYRKIGPSVVVVETADGSLGSGVIATDDGPS